MRSVGDGAVASRSDGRAVGVADVHRDRRLGERGRLLAAASGRRARCAVGRHPLQVFHCEAVV